MTDFREDAAAAADWVARYLEGVRERPVLAQVEPGEVPSPSGAVRRGRAAVA